jgi:hypothetical protein
MLTAPPGATGQTFGWPWPVAGVRLAPLWSMVSPSSLERMMVSIPTKASMPEATLFGIEMAPRMTTLPSEL